MYIQPNRLPLNFVLLLAAAVAAVGPVPGTGAEKVAPVPWILPATPVPQPRDTGTPADVLSPVEDHQGFPKDFTYAHPS